MDYKSEAIILEEFSIRPIELPVSYSLTVVSDVVVSSSLDVSDVVTSVVVEEEESELHPINAIELNANAHKVCGIKPAEQHPLNNLY